MDVYEIERHLRNQPDFLYVDGSLIDILIEKLKEVTRNYEGITEVLYELNLSDDPSTLEDELRTVYYDWDCDQTELKSLKEEFEQFKASL
jgi:hypothetical protein